LKNLLDDDVVNNMCEPAIQVCQWRARAVDGSSFNCEFWYNSGGLKRDELLEQFNQVVMRCETIGFRVLGFVCDAGGPNTRLMTLLRRKTELPEGGWLPLNVVTTVNPFETSRKICLFHCSTHDLKAMRNALYTSWQTNGKKQFCDENDIKIGKGIIEECFQKDRQREIGNLAPLSEIRETTVYLNKWSVMDAMEAKRPFSWKSLCAMLEDIYIELNEKPLCIKLHGQIGYMPSAAKHVQELLQKKDQHIIDSLHPKLSSFEWLANVHEIFNATLMDTSLLIKPHNIDK
jgi:hypothetical protein